MHFLSLLSLFAQTVTDVRVNKMSYRDYVYLLYFVYSNLGLTHA